MTAQPPFDPGAYRSDAVPSDTQAIYIQEGGAEPRGILFHSPTKHPKILRLQEIMIVSALLCFIHGVISSFAPDNLSPLKGLPEVGVAGGIGLLVVSAVVYIWVYFTIQKGGRGRLGRRRIRRRGGVPGCRAGGPGPRSSRRWS